MKKEVQHYALNAEEELVFIKEVDKTKGQFFCPHCHKEMICKQGKIRDWHFAHKGEECGYDNYLHALAEKRICDWYNQAEKVEIVIPYSEKCKEYNDCKWRIMNYSDAPCRASKEKIFNLKQWFPSCKIEADFTKDGKQFRADLLCRNPKNEQNPLFIEIYVTHKCEEQKRTSGIRIIEVKIESESDIDDFISKPIHGTIVQEKDEQDFSYIYEEVYNRNVNYYGFRPKDIFVETQETVPIGKFIYYKTGKTFLKWSHFNCKNYATVHWGIMEISLFKDESGIPLPFAMEEGGLYRVLNAVVKRDYPQHKHCRICKYMAYNEYYNELICILYKKCGTNLYCKDNDAQTCPYFQYDEIKCAPLLKEFERMQSEGTFEVWRKEEGG